MLGRLLDVLHGQERAEVASGGIDRSGYYSGEGFAQLGEFGYQGFDHGGIFLKGAGSVRDIRGLIFHDNVQVVADGERKDFGDVEDLAGGAQIHGLAAGGQVGSLSGLNLVVKFVGGQSGHEIHGSGEENRFAVVEPGVVILGFRFEIAGAVGKPSGVMSGNLRDSGEKAGELPVAAGLLQNQRQGHGRVPAAYVENSDSIFAGGQIGEDEFGAVFRLSEFAEDTAEKFSARKRIGALGNQQERWTDRGLRSGKVRLVVFHGGFDAGKVGGDRSNRVLLERRGIALRRHLEITFGRGLEGGADGSVHVGGSLAGLGRGRSGWKHGEQQNQQPARRRKTEARKGAILTGIPRLILRPK